MGDLLSKSKVLKVDIKHWRREQNCFGLGKHGLEYNTDYLRMAVQRYFHDQQEEVNRRDQFRSLNQYGGKTTAPVLDANAQAWPEDGGDLAPVKGKGEESKKRPKNKYKGKGKGDTSRQPPKNRPNAAAEGDQYAPLSSPEDLELAPPGTFTNASGAPIIRWYYNNGGCNIQNCEYWHKMLPDHLKYRLKKPGTSHTSHSVTRKGKGKGKGKKSAHAAPTPVPAGNDQNADNIFKGLIQKCKDKGVMI